MNNNELSFKTILAYHRRELQEQELKRVKRIIECSPHYKGMLEGIILLSQELKEEEELENFLRKSKTRLLRRFFTISILCLLATVFTFK